MNFLEKIIRQIQKDVYCPICGKNYTTDRIKVRGFFDSVVIIQTACEDGHKVVLMASFSKVPLPPKKEISLDEVLDLHDKLKNFDGDFEKQCKK